MIKKTILNELIETHDVMRLEQHLVYAYLMNNKFDFAKSAIISTYFKDFEQIPKLYFYTSILSMSTIKELENYLELIIPIEDRKLNGAFFTPDYIIDFIINEIQPKETDMNLDPSYSCFATQ